MKHPQKKNAPEFLADPVEAYDRIGRVFGCISEVRRHYLRAVDAAVLSRIPTTAFSLLDVGTGDGRRALEIVNKTGINEIVLIEPSQGMAKRLPNSVEVWNLRAEDLDLTCQQVGGRRFDVITCLWNVLGHVTTHELRGRALVNLRSLLADNGSLFMDVVHRYNAKSYGWTKTAMRFLRDRAHFDGRSGDVTVRWDVDEVQCSTYGHVFTDPEVRTLAANAGLTIAERMVVDYDTGEERRFGFQGNLFYVLRRTSASASPSAPQTSSISSFVS